ncbi:MAG: TetR/AcrR family transcriptional regulator, partial [Ignavibacteria bacterium]
MLFRNISNLEGLSRKEREKLFKKHEILSAALKLFANKGYEKTTLDEIASAAEFGKGTLYNYFSNKEEIFVAILEEVTTGYLNQLKSTFDSTASLKELILNVSKNIFKFFIERTEEFILMHSVRTQTISFDPREKSEVLRNNLDSIRSLYRQRISDAIKKNEIIDVDLDSIQLLIQSMFFGYLHQLYMCGATENLDVDKECEFVV